MLPRQAARGRGNSNAFLDEIQAWVEAKDAIALEGESDEAPAAPIAALPPRAEEQV